MLSKKLQAWLRELRSGDYQQTTGRLVTGDTFCCLGVLCNITAGYVRRENGFAWGGAFHETNPEHQTFKDLGFTEYVDVMLLKGKHAAGLQKMINSSCNVGNVFTVLNDSLRITFNEVADFVEENLEALLNE